MKTTDEMVAAAKGFIDQLKQTRDGMKFGSREEGIPQLNETELFLLAYVDYLEGQIESEERLNEINRRGRELVKKHREQCANIIWGDESEQKEKDR